VTADAAASAPGRAGGRWLSRNPSKAWGERFFLAYSPVWIVAFGLYQRSGVSERLGDLGNLLLTAVIAAPLVVLPALIRDESGLGRPWHRTYWFKFALWMLVFATVGTYFLTAYFFDVLGMVYHYPYLTWAFDSALLGSGRQTVPVIMYLHAWYFFATYHTCSVILLRRIRTSRFGASTLASLAAVAATAWFFAWAEMFFTTDPSIAHEFRYEDLPWALRWGTWFYACYFVVSFPMVYRLDEEPGENWPVSRVVIEALAAGMLAFFLLDLVTHVVGARWGHAASPG
jgi:cycloeucalenol cycloisomerase